MSLDKTKLLRIRWTEEVIREAAISIGRRYPGSAESIEQKLLAYSQVFGGSRVSGYEHLIGSLGCRDPKDEHVLAATIVSKSRYLLSFNLRDYPEDAYQRFGVTVTHPDDFLSLTANNQSEAFAHTVAQWLAIFVNPQISVKEASVSLAKSGCPKIAGWMQVNASVLESKLRMERLQQKP